MGRDRTGTRPGPWVAASKNAMVFGTPLIQAAKALKKSPATLRRWIQKEHCPCERQGEVGRGKGALLNLDAVQQWRIDRLAPALKAKGERLQLEQLADSLMRTFRNDQAAAKVGITDRQAAQLLLLVFARAATDLTRAPVDLDTLPEQMKRLCAICVD